MSHKTIIFTSGGGRLANQITNLAHFSAFELECESKFIVFNLAFAPYAKYFDKSTRIMKKIPFTKKRNISSILYTSETKIAKFFRKQSIRMIHWTASINQHVQSVVVGDIPNHYSMLYGKSFSELNLEKEKAIDLFNKKRITYLAGWPIRCWKYLRKHSDIIRKDLKFDDNLSYEAAEYIKNIKSKYELLIGVFIRQTDYSTWNDGKYYFEDIIYLNWLNQLEKYFSGKKIGFIIASDSFKGKHVFNKDNHHFASGSPMGNASYIHSFIELTMCDYILSPPSTYGAWAAFFGKIPLIAVYKKEQKISKKDFLNENIFDAINHTEFSKAIH